MSIRHRVAVAVLKADPKASYAYETFTTGNTCHFVFEQERSAEIVSAMLRTIFKRKPLLHNGRKPR